MIIEMDSRFLLLGIIFMFETCNCAKLHGSWVTRSIEEPKEKDPSPSKEVVAPKIYEMHIDTNVTNRYAKTLITSKVKNSNSNAQEATFSVITPDKAFISGFTMEINGKKYEAYVKEKEEAKKTYDQAVSSGQSAAHVAVSARDSNRFTVSVNVEPESKAIFYLTYEELLVRKDEKYEVVLNIHPGQPVPVLTVQVNIAESRPLKFVEVPSLRRGNEISKNDPNVSPEADILNVNDTSAVITFSPDIAKQKILTEGLKGKEQDGLNGQFVVQYDVIRDPQGEVLVDSGYFVHFFAPEELTPLKKQAVFVLDTSGSMSGKRIEQLIQAMESILSELKPEDIFSIVEFSSSVKVWNVPLLKITFEQGDKYPYSYLGGTTEKHEIIEQVLPLSIEASPENIDNAKKVIKKLEAEGGTDIESALKVGLDIVGRNADPKSHQPIIIFLTDGEPTVGVTSPDKITSTITELNTRKIPIFSLSFGDGADRKFLQQLSLKNQGFSRHIYEAADASLQLEEFYKQISSPLLSNITFKYVDKVDDVTRKHFPILFKGGELFTTGKIIDPGFIPPTVEGNGFRGPIHFQPKVYQAVGSLERLWAYLTVKQLLEKRDVVEDKKIPTEQALKLALKYSFVTDVSSLVVVKPNTTSTVDTEDAAKVPPRTFGISNNSPWSYGARPVYHSAHPSSAFVHHRVAMTSVLRGGMSGPPAFFAPPAPYPTLQYRSTTIQPSKVIPPSTEASEDNFPNIPWLKHSLNTNGTITLHSGTFSLGIGENTSLKQNCNNSLNNANGTCTLLTQCPQIHLQLTDLPTYEKHFCEIESFAGVCCPL